LPAPVYRLLNGARPPEREAAWEEFLETYSPLFLQVARSVTSDEDGARDAFATVLEGLRDDDFRRLRQFKEGGRATFRTWLAVVSRRLCHDFLRSRYGRARGGKPSDTRTARARLVDLVGARIDLVHLRSRQPGPEGALRKKEITAALGEALARLPARDRLLLALRFEDGLPVREIRDLTADPSVFHVYRRLRKVLGRLREDLERAGIDGSQP
jgi:RNA polymerase sigma factor (sigma-70 family)